MKTEEHRIQVAIVRYLRIMGVMVFAVPNGGKRDAKTGAYLKDEGALAGVADLIILLPNRCIFIEVKTDKGDQQQTQKDFEQRVKGLGYEYYVWRSLDDAIEFTKIKSND